MARNSGDSHKPVPAPAVTFREEAAGRETLAAIAEDRAGALHPFAYRGPAATKAYGDRISNAPGAVSPKTARALDDAPEISVSEHRAGQATLAAIRQDHRAEGPDISVEPYRPSQETYALIERDDDGPDIFVEDAHRAEPETPNIYALRIERVFTFHIHASVEYFRTKAQQKRLLDGRLLRQMPGVSMDDVQRVEVRESGPRAMIINVFVTEAE